MLLVVVVGCSNLGSRVPRSIYMGQAGRGCCTGSRSALVPCSGNICCIGFVREFGFWSNFWMLLVISRWGAFGRASGSGWVVVAAMPV